MSPNYKPTYKISNHKIEAIAIAQRGKENRERWGVKFSKVCHNECKKVAGYLGVKLGLSLLRQKRVIGSLDPSLAQTRKLIIIHNQ